MKKIKNKKIWCVFLACILSICMCVSPILGAEDVGVNGVPKEREYGYSYNNEWNFGDCSNLTDFPYISYSGKVKEANSTAYFNDYKVFGANKNDYICVGYHYEYSGINKIAVLLYDKDTKEYISAVNVYQQYDILNRIYNDDTPTEHKETAGGSLLQFSNEITFQNCNIPVFDTRKACDDYVATGSVKGAVALPDELKCEKPQNLSLYTDDNNNKMINIVWKQTDSIKSSYRSQITVAYQYKDDDDYSDMKGFIIDQDYNTAKDNVVRFDLSEIITNSGLDISGGYTQINLAFGVFNYDVSNSLGKSDTEVVAVLINKNGIFYQLEDDAGNIVQGQPIKNSTQFKNDNGYSFDDFTTIDSVSNNGFINSILSGFGLIGNNGLISFLVNVFAYVPSWLWSLIGTGIAFMIIIALFKLVVH